jgi:ribosomal protein S14
MNSNKIKNLKIRNKFFIFENKKLIWKFLYINLLSIKSLSKKNFLKLFLTIKNNLIKISKVQIKNKCVLTGRNRSVNKKFSISRIEMRNLMKFGVIPGFKKAVW